jgi:Family of unknown function (DUF6476)
MGMEMRALKIAVVVMGVLIVVGTIGLVVGVLHRGSSAVTSASLPPVVTAILQEPEGTRIASIAALADRLAVQLQGGGTDRVVLIDPKTGALAGRISLAH